MTNTKEVTKLGIYTYGFALLIFSVLSVIYSLASKDSNSELFGFNIFGSLLIYGVSAILFMIIISFIDIKNATNTFLIIILLFLIEIPAIFSMGSFILFSAFKYDNPFSLCYYLAVLIAYQISKRKLKIKLPKSKPFND